jgi:hypothetical protein
VVTAATTAVDACGHSGTVAVRCVNRLPLIASFPTLIPPTPLSRWLLSVVVTELSLPSRTRHAVLRCALLTRVTLCCDTEVAAAGTGAKAGDSGDGDGDDEESSKYSLQTAFDLLGEVCKFNIEALVIMETVRCIQLVFAVSCSLLLSFVVGFECVVQFCRSAPFGSLCGSYVPNAGLSCLRLCTLS